MKGSRAGALLAGLTAALTLAACGVPPSGVIEAGEPASGMLPPSPKPPAPAAVSLYFLHNGELRPYLRSIGDPGDFGAVVRLLFAGPTTSEATTATTELPRLTDTLEVAIGGDDALLVHLPKDVPPLSHPAMLQLACTVAHMAPLLAVAPADGNRDGASTTPPDTAQPSPAHSNVRVIGDGWTITQSADSCPGSLQP
ncbi:hypothetical protein ACF08M_06030 [Streptomyces sp. NPDC015032]|uniref:hypothetical protein n=1 Tax=Streptomyces sp. NPDC015032 TaxID=3364937 RepID=UPI0037035A69